MCAVSGRSRRVAPEGDLVWIGNWGDDEREAELDEFLLEPVRALALDATVHGVRYPERALAKLRRAGIRYARLAAQLRGAANVFARHRVTVHVPRRPYVEALPGIPTIRVFEALACGIPLVSAPWRDAEGLFTPAATSSSPPTARRCEGTSTTSFTTTRLRRRSPSTAGRRSSPATPAPIASTSCSRSMPSSSPSAVGSGR